MKLLCKIVAVKSERNAIYVCKINIFVIFETDYLSKCEFTEVNCRNVLFQRLFKMKCVISMGDIKFIIFYLWKM